MRSRRHTVSRASRAALLPAALLALATAFLLPASATPTWGSSSTSAQAPALERATASLLAVQGEAVRSLPIALRQLPREVKPGRVLLPAAAALGAAWLLLLLVRRRRTDRDAPTSPITFRLCAFAGRAPPLAS